MFATPQSMLESAKKGGYAVGAFNAENAEMVWAITEAAKELRAPVIIQTTSSTLRHLPPIYFANMVKAGATGHDIPIAMHLDHGSSYQLAQECIENGYTSVMIDGSSLPYDENIELSKQVCDYALPRGIAVEAELGKVGGKEDDTVSETIEYTDPQQAIEFVERTGITSLAIAVGTAHGLYTGKPHINMDRISEIRNLVDIPLVLHGASGLSDRTVREAVSRGICKINFATELRIAFSYALKAYNADNVGVYDPKKYLSAAREAVKTLVKEKIRVCGSYKKA